MLLYFSEYIVELLLYKLLILVIFSWGMVLVLLLFYELSNLSEQIVLNSWGVSLTLGRSDFWSIDNWIIGFIDGVSGCVFRLSWFKLTLFSIDFWIWIWNIFFNSLIYFTHRFKQILMTVVLRIDFNWRWLHIIESACKWLNS